MHKGRLREASLVLKGTVTRETLLFAPNDDLIRLRNVQKRFRKLMDDATEKVTSEGSTAEQVSDPAAETELSQPTPALDNHESATEEVPLREEAGDGDTEKSVSSPDPAPLDPQALLDSDVSPAVESAASDPPESPQSGATRGEQTNAPQQAAFKFSDETLKALIEGIVYVAPEPVSFEVISKVLEGEERDRIKAKLEELIEDFERPEHGVQIRQVAGGYKFYSKAEHHEVLRRFVKSLKPPIRLSRQALETLAVIAYRQPVTLPEIEEIRGVDCGGVIHTLLQKKLVLTAGRKNVVGRPILYRSSREFLVHFGLRDLSELPSMKEFEDLARQALGSELVQEPVIAQPEGDREQPVVGPQPPAEQAMSDQPPAANEHEQTSTQTSVLKERHGNHDVEQQAQEPVRETEREQ